MADFEDHHVLLPTHYAEHGYPHDVFAKWRREEPVKYIEQPGGAVPFYAITKHEDITFIGRRPDLFLNGPRLVIDHEPEIEPVFPPTLIQLDPPKHGIYRKMVNKRFTPGALRHIHGDIERIGKDIVDALIQDSHGGECDFVEKISAPLPIAVISWLLGVPEPDWPMLFDWTNRILGAQDPEFCDPNMTGAESSMAAMTELFSYFTELVEQKRKNPADDLVTLFTTLEYEGKPIPPMDVLTWCLIIVVAGNETTRNATTGGMLALIEHQDQLRKLQAEPELMRSAVEEMVRWTSPIIHFGRTATQDVEIRGTKIKQGEALALFYPAANRDEDVFPDGDTFRIDRSPNRHLGFGVGEHFCLGAHVARLEMIVAFKYLLPRIDEIELAGDVARLRSAFVGGIKRLPVRYKLSK
jgi:cholest-4-en-3-one 26-monooxygenase